MRSFVWLVVRADYQSMNGHTFIECLAVSLMWSNRLGTYLPEEYSNQWKFSHFCLPHVSVLCMTGRGKPLSLLMSHVRTLRPRPHSALSRSVGVRRSEWKHVTGALSQQKRRECLQCCLMGIMWVTGDFKWLLTSILHSPSPSWPFRMLAWSVPLAKMAAYQWY